MEESLQINPAATQRSGAWFEQRMGKFTASTFGDCMGTGRGKDSIFTLNGQALIREKITEILTGETKHISGDALDWGTENEEFAIQMYESITGNHVLDAPFCPVEGFEDYAGGSPDGFVEEENGIIEVKCPYNSINHVDTLIDGKIPAKYYVKYYTQIQFNIMATDTEFCDFISYDPRMIQKELQMKVVRIKRDEKYIQKIKERLEMAIDEVQRQLDLIGYEPETQTFINHDNDVLE